MARALSHRLKPSGFPRRRRLTGVELICVKLGKSATLATMGAFKRPALPTSPAPAGVGCRITSTPSELGHLDLRDYLKTEVATNDDTIREHSSVAASPSSSLPSSHTSPANLDTSRASPMFVRPPSDAPDSVSVLTRRASPLRSDGYAADSRIWRPSRGQWGCHIPYPDTDAEDSALLDEVAQPPLTPVSPPTAWHRERSLPPPLCSVGHHLHLREYCAWFPASLGQSDCDRLHPPQTGFAH